MNKALQIIPNKLDKSIAIIPENPYFSLIWLHGLGDSSVGFLDYFQIPQSPAFRGAKINLLQAPQRRVTINGGAYYNSWYDIKSFAGSGNDQDRYNIDQIKDSLAIIDKNVTNQIQYWKQRGIKDNQEQICKRIFLGGFSQGCAMSLCYGLTSDRVLGGLIGFSGHLFQSFNLKNKGIVPILAYHGQYDDVLSYKWTKSIYDRHLKNCVNFDLKMIKGLPHSVTVQQLQQSTQWMLHLLQKQQIK